MPWQKAGHFELRQVHFTMAVPTSDTYDWALTKWQVRLGDVKSLDGDRPQVARGTSDSVLLRITGSPESPNF